MKSCGSLTHGPVLGQLFVVDTIQWTKKAVVAAIILKRITDKFTIKLKVN